MKIILVGTAYPLRGGIAHYVGLLWKYFSRAHDVEVVTFKRQYPKLLFPGTSQEESGEAGIALTSHVWIDSINPFNWIRVGFKIRKMNADLLLFKFWMPFFAPCYGVIAMLARWGRATKIFFIDDNVIPHEKRFGDKLLTKFAFRFVDGHIVQSHAVQKDLLLWQPNAKWKYLPHPVYEIFGEELPTSEARTRVNELIREADARTSFRIEEGETVLLFFGYIREYKGLHILLDAMPEILRQQKVKLLVVGEFYGNEERYRKQAEALGLNDQVFFYSRYVSNENVRYFFSASDVLTLPYVSATQSGIIQIAYNFHRPVIAPDVGGLAEVVIDGETGFIVAPENPPAIARATLEFITERKFEAFRRNVIEEKKKYSWEYMIEGIESFYSELTSDRSD